MKKATRKIYLSVIFVALSLLTMVATTFAWVGIVSNASFEKITINLETDNEESDYGVMLSLTGKEGDFHDSIDAIDLQKQILINMGVPEKTLQKEMNIRNTFNSIGLTPCTVTRMSDGTGLYSFTDNYGYKPYAYDDGFITSYSGYFSFDIWITIYKIGDDVTGSENKLSVYLRGGDKGILSSDYSSSFIANDIIYPDDSNPMSSQYLDTLNSFGPGKVVAGEIYINPANATRLSVQKARSVRLYDYDNSNNDDYRGLKIFKTGSNIPRYDSRFNVYDFGGVLPSDYNFAWKQYNSTRTGIERVGEVPENVINRGDVTFVDDGVTNHIVDKTDNVTTSDMIKMHFNFWFEGWDSDCFEGIDSQRVDINLSFSTKNPKDEG